MVVTSKENKENFLNHLAERLQYERHSLGDSELEFRNNLPHETLSDLSKEELLEVAMKQCEALNCGLLTTTFDNLLSTLTGQMNTYENGNLIVPDDARFEEYGLSSIVQSDKTYVWKKGGDKREVNLDAAQGSNIGITFAEYLLAESGTVVLESSSGQGRALHFLPTYYISIVPMSKLVARSTFATDDYAARIRAGEKVGSALNFISGPSNSGDIEMVLVEGVHGPLAVTYIVVEDR